MPIGNALAVIRSFRPFPPIITSGDSVIWRVNQPDFNYLITAINNPETFNATPLPAGLSFDPNNRTITGTPTVINVAGTNVTTSATNRGGTGTKRLNIKVYPEPPEIINPYPYTPLYLSGIQDQPLSYKIVATNMDASYLPSYGASGLPAGLSINTNTGIINGTISSVGVTFGVVVSAKNISGIDTDLLNIEIKMAPPVITQPQNFTQGANTFFVYQISATNSPIAYPTAGLPPGLVTNDTTGEIVGTLPNLTTAQTYTVTVSAYNSTGYGIPRTFTITVICPPVITSSLNLIGYTNELLKYKIIATNMQAAYLPSYEALNLPSGLTFDPNTATIEGIPLNAGITDTQIGATNSAGSDTKTLTIEIRVRPPVVTQPRNFTEPFNSSFSYQIVATNNPTSYEADGLPPGLSLNPTTGLITGTLPNATKNEDYTITINAANAGGSGTSRTFTIKVVAPPIITMTSLVVTGGESYTSPDPFYENGPLTSYSISPTRPPTGSGLDSASISTGGNITIFGNNNTGSTLTYQLTVIAGNAAGTATQTIDVTILPKPPPAVAPTVTVIDPFKVDITFKKGVYARFSNLCKETGGTVPITWSVAALPAGLSIDSTTGDIFGTATSSTGVITYQWTASNAAGSSSKGINVSVIN